MNTTKIVFIGAGSLSFGVAMLRDVFSSNELIGSTLTLVDIDEEALERTYQVALGMNRVAGTGLSIEKTTNRREALPGAGFVVNSICVERCALWRQDFAIPQKYGVRHTLGENGGPGGLSFTLRTLPMIMDIVRDMEELCPDAYFLNFSNPESRIILALGRYTKIRAIGLCHGVFMGHSDVAKILGKPYEEIDVTGVGLNHFQWLTEVRDAKTGEDLYPALRTADATYDPAFEPLARKLFRAFDLYPSCSDDHIGEYLSFGYEAGEEGYNFDGDNAHRVVVQREMEQRIREDRFADWLTPSGERAVEAITGILHNKKRTIESGVIYNRGAIGNLASDAAVEVPIHLDASGITPLHMSDLPAGCARILTGQVMVQQAAVDAAVYADKHLALQALLIDPVIQSTDAAVGILDELWALNAPYIRRCV